MTTVAIIDYGMGNLRSVAKAIEHVAPKESFDTGRLADKVPALMTVKRSGYDFVAEVAPQGARYPGTWMRRRAITCWPT